MPTTGLAGFALVLPIALTALGLAVAAMIRSIEFERVGAFLIAVVGVTVGGWATSFLWPVILSNPSYGAVYGASLVINIAALGLTSLVVDGFKIRGFMGLIVAGVVVTLVENSMTLFHLARMLGT